MPSARPSRARPRRRGDHRVCGRSARRRRRGRPRAGGMTEVEDAWGSGTRTAPAGATRRRRSPARSARSTSPPASKTPSKPSCASASSRSLRPRSTKSSTTTCSSSCAPGADAARAALEDEPPALVYTNVLDFMTGYLMPIYRRSLSGSATTWCPEWWRHAEANTRLEALWRSWEHLRLDPATGISVWLRDHLDHHMRVLLDTDGPFKGCSPEKGHNEQRLKPLPLTQPPGRALRARLTASRGAIRPVRVPRQRATRRKQAGQTRTHEAPMPTPLAPRGRARTRPARSSQPGKVLARRLQRVRVCPQRW